MASTITWRPTDDMAAWMTRRGADVAAPPSLSARTRTEMDLWREAQRIDLARTGWTLVELGILAAAMQAGMTSDTVSQLPGGDITIALQEFTSDSADLLSARDKASRLSACATIAMEHAVTQWWDLGLDHTAEAWRGLGIRVVG
ncbi:hypothetical protein BI041_gp26 [Propionibacterium phage PFR2]|uniref:Uncharacterized protein n=2 Tax=Pulverervirus PFR1 TaxID=2170091 RepID=A0A173G9Y6_9CAUD|nr:hypothetical protein [Propionibacterium freudenreichii]YP_009287700.1 hypothetical protein BI042_gp24 [Propionibacterium phage PFR1]YP_009290933.1 hypothetical protein BI041_gp26 [Propionibacterium phage PFR2]ANH49889.1 hypothetical protein PFR1_24 [Propionibacterium phage PFR1]ANH49949.1 hypothetical protein PFR_24 [Propionibacterium phage PFR2]MDK9674455.1 hypothetical protein [Propionibacterium freudenreichii]CEI46763.1 Protein of unknown function [Propionibacterium freudenreichii]SCQ4